MCQTSHHIFIYLSYTLFCNPSLSLVVILSLTITIP